MTGMVRVGLEHEFSQLRIGPVTLLSLSFFRLSNIIWNRTWNSEDVAVECIKRKFTSWVLFSLGMHHIG